MRDLKLASGIRIAFVLLVFTTSRAFGGFTDTAYGGEVTPPMSEESPAESQLDFDVTGDRPGDYHPPVQQLSQRQTPPAAAPLPVALLPGGILLAGSFIATRVFKRRIV